ncbi:MAG: PadR family transcriptional regulator [Sulfolobaceae archaeon]|nr:PadR family transcriptional regulator [Sulfolobaceae archaeon]
MYRGPERLRKGILKALVLEALNDGPKSPYEIIKYISVKFNNLYKPSTGSIYPVLRTLSSEGLVKIDNSDIMRKKYMLTSKGIEKYSEVKKSLEEFFSQTSPYRDILNELIDISFVIYKNKEKIMKNKDIETKVYESLKRIKEELLAIFNEVY